MGKSFDASLGRCEQINEPVVESLESFTNIRFGASQDSFVMRRGKNEFQIYATAVCRGESAQEPNLCLLLQISFACTGICTNAYNLRLYTIKYRSSRCNWLNFLYLPYKDMQFLLSVIEINERFLMRINLRMKRTSKSSPYYNITALQCV